MNKIKPDYNYKLITVILETRDGLQIQSSWMFPQYRDPRNPNSPFKDVGKDPVKWFKNLLK